jgi:hypothetical protein
MSTMIMPTTETIRERLAELVEMLNATVDPVERVEIHHEVERLRNLLRGAK